jgi:bifunctional UDP-N-acetylglucosamine pyrophosphorylase / glucosamine-1-phosphate N-acetyltransferase
MVQPPTLMASPATRIIRHHRINRAGHRTGMLAGAAKGLEMNNVDVVIMAAGKGTRMKSAWPKVLHKLAGRSLLGHVLNAGQRIEARSCTVITGHGALHIEAAFPNQGLNFVRQEPQLGTGHAVQQTVPHLPDDGICLILNGDVPLIQEATLRQLTQACGADRLALLTCVVDDATGYGRIVRDAGGAVLGIVEHKDANAAQREIKEFYTGVMAAPNAKLKQWLARLDNRNAQGEFYLTDVVGFAVADGVAVVATQPSFADEVAGVNSPVQLAELERSHQLRQAQSLMEAGVRLADPARIDVRGELLCGQDVEIDVNCVFEGRVELKDGARVGANCVLRDVTIGAGAVIHPMCHLEGAQVGANALIGPFARLRPGAILGEEVHIGNFVEVKNSSLAKGAKANHLAYLGDSQVGERVNYGAGSITANYDGANKLKTIIEADAHIGSNCVLVAPVVIGQGGTVGAGSVITKDTPAGALSVARGKQVSLSDWTRPAKKK